MAAYPLRAAFAGVLLFVIGLAIASSLLRTNLQDRERLRDWRRADGTVVELLKRRTVDGEVTVPLIAFTTPRAIGSASRRHGAHGGARSTSTPRSRSSTVPSIRRRR